MRRKEKRCPDEKMLIEFLHESKVVHIGIPGGKDESPYVVPMNYVYNNGALFVHSAPVGCKVNLLESKPKVGFAISEMLGVAATENPCKTTTKYKSVIGEAKPEFIENNCMKRDIMNMMMMKYTETKEIIQFDDETLDNVLIIRFAINFMDFKMDTGGI